MVRIYKHYDFELASPDHKLRRASFSGYPGELSSDDDFYLLDTGLAVLQTTNDILDAGLYSLLSPRSVLNWQRVRWGACSPLACAPQACGGIEVKAFVHYAYLHESYHLSRRVEVILWDGWSRVANAMATTGGEWADAVGICNSGTYNNQYMVVDLKLFYPGHELRDGLLWIVEQVRRGCLRLSHRLHSLLLSCMDAKHTSSSHLRRSYDGPPPPSSSPLMHI
jgi:hypothetical protein